MSEEAPVQTPEITTSTTLGELSAALAQAQGEFKPIVKNRTNTFYNAKYADLESVISSVKESLSKHGLALMQFPTVFASQKRVGVTTLLSHGNEWVKFVVGPVPAEEKVKDASKEVFTKFDVQTIGKAITYLRRYSLLSVLNLAADDDADGNEFVDEPKKPAEAKQISSVARTASDLPTKEQRDAFGKELKKYKIDSRILKNFVYTFAGVTDPDGWEKITTTQWKEVLDAIAKANVAGTLEGFLNVA